MKRRMRLVRSTLFFAVLALMLGVVVRTALAGPQVAPGEAERLAAERVEPAADVAADSGDAVGARGIIEPTGEEVRLAAGGAGRVVAIHHGEGDFVTAGTVLLELEHAAEDAALAVAEAEVRVAQASLLRLRRGQRVEDVQALDAELEAARARAAGSRGVFERVEVAAGRGAATEDELDRARRQAEADARTVSAVEARASASRGGRREDVVVAVAQLRSAEARRDQARASLELRRVVAPRDAEVLAVRFHVGEYVAPSFADPLVVLGDTRQLVARLDVDESDLARVHVGDGVEVRADAFPERVFRGRVVSLARRMGRKIARADEPTERIDTKVLECVVTLEAFDGLVPGVRVMGRISAIP